MKRRDMLTALGISSAAALAPKMEAAKSTFEQDVKILPPRRNDKDVFLQQVDKVSNRGPFSDSWDSLVKYQTPDWYADAKFGIFIHWGVYSVPAFLSEWYPRMMYQPSNPVFWRHRLKWGPQDKFGYKDFIPMFRAEKFDADAWIDLFKKAGARYVVPVAEHHDGFSMYDNGFSEWNASRMGPKRDIIREIEQAARRKGITFGLSSHRAEHWWFFNGGRKFKSDVRDGRWESLYGPAQPEKAAISDAHLKDWLARCAELVDNYQPQVFWFDWWIEQPAFEPYRRKFAAYYYNRAAEWGKSVALNYKHKSFPDGAAVLDLERSGLGEIRPLLWQTDTSISYISWGYIKGDKFKSPSKLIKELVDASSKNGLFLLNIGPKPDGTIPDQAQQTLLEIGKWLARNGDAVYGTRPWKIFGEGPTRISRNTKYGLGEISEKELTARDIRFTQKGDTLYAVVMGWPEDRQVAIKTLGKNSKLAAGAVKSVRLLDSNAELKWNQGDDALMVGLPPEKPGEHAYALEIKGVI